jgi:hypothetical protein
MNAAESSEQLSSRINFNVIVAFRIGVTPIMCRMHREAIKCFRGTAVSRSLVYRNSRADGDVS